MTETQAILPELDDYNWEYAFGFASPHAVAGDDSSCDPFDREDVAEICGIRDGINDESNWIVYGRLRDGRWFFLTAWCDYTGWDCRSGGSAVVASTRSQIERFGLDEDARAEFKIDLPEAVR